MNTLDYTTAARSDAQWKSRVRAIKIALREPFPILPVIRFCRLISMVRHGVPLLAALSVATIDSEEYSNDDLTPVYVSPAWVVAHCVQRNAYALLGLDDLGLDLEPLLIPLHPVSHRDAR